MLLKKWGITKELVLILLKLYKCEQQLPNPLFKQGDPWFGNLFSQTVENQRKKKYNEMMSHIYVSVTDQRVLWCF